ncbi:uncharacterized protein LOC116618832 [Nematostella vectensis]|uniref:uncharacterized protein LOC116618832 n=1 Tax=Nematostella vectensis TaxID=45351 RepID=UPI0020778D9D|nr:uncharacterized protein LOC116618832 [Nematostella vectensis]
MSSRLYGVDIEDIEELEIRVVGSNTTINKQQLTDILTSDKLPSHGFTCDHTRKRYAVLKEVPFIQVAEVEDEIKDLFPGTFARSCLKTLRKEGLRNDLGTKSCTVGFEMTAVDWTKDKLYSVTAVLRVVM